MTIVESFEKAPIENMISVLAAKPEKVIFLGDAVQMRDPVRKYKDILKKKGIKTEIQLKGIQKNNLKNILSVLTSLVEKEEELILDVTGGEDLVLLAFGIIYERYKEKKPIKMQRFNVNSGKVIDCDYDNEISFRDSFSMGIDELIALYGGVVVPEEELPMIDQPLETVDKVWNLARKNGTKWNKVHSYLKELEHKTDVSEELLEVRMEFEGTRHEIGEFQKKYSEVIALLTEFERAGLIIDFKVNEYSVYYKYRDTFVKRCLVNSGDALEMKCYCEALELTEKGRAYFNDCCVGVTIDWDGVIHSKNENWKDTTNEIDLLLMRGLIPTFVSCKNGKIGEEELYKLNTVAEKFGGKYAKKMLIATKLERDNYVAKMAYMRRAEDMGIKIIPNAGELTKEDWAKIFK